LNFLCPDTDLTYRFLLCRTTLVDPKHTLPEGVLSTLGSFAYYILSDGREAGTTVKLTFGP